MAGYGKANALGAKLSCQPTVAVQVELQAKRAPGRHAQIDESELLVHEIQVMLICGVYYYDVIGAAWGILLSEVSRVPFSYVLVIRKLV